MFYSTVFYRSLSGGKGEILKATSDIKKAQKGKGGDSSG